MTPEDPRASPYVDPAGAAVILCTSRKAIYQRIARGQMPGVRKVGGRLLIRRSDLISCIEASALSPTKGSGR